MWFITKNGTEVGPLSNRQLRELALTKLLLPSDAIRASDSVEVLSADSINGLFQPETKTSRPVPPPPPMPHSEPPPLPRVQKFSVSPFAVAIIGLVLLTVSTIFAVVKYTTTNQLITSIQRGNQLWEEEKYAEATDEYQKFIESYAKTSSPDPIIFERVINKKLLENNIDNAKAVYSLAEDHGIHLSLTDEEMKRFHSNQKSNSHANNEEPPTNSQVQDKATSPPAKMDNPDFSNVDYSYDYSQDNFDTIPDGAVRETKEESIDGGWVVKEGYRTGDGRFVKHGDFTHWSDRSKTTKHVSSRFFHGKEHGVLRLWHPNGQLKEEIYYKDDLRNGKYRKWSNDGSIIYEGQYSNGLVAGEWRLRCVNGPQSFYRTAHVLPWNGGTIEEFKVRLALLGIERGIFSHYGVPISGRLPSFPVQEFEDVFGKPDLQLAINRGQMRWYYYCSDGKLSVLVTNNPANGGVVTIEN